MKNNCCNVGNCCGNVYWETRNGEVLNIRNMDTGHIQNCIIILTEKSEKCSDLGIGEFDYNGNSATWWINQFKIELTRRHYVDLWGGHRTF